MTRYTVVKTTRSEKRYLIKKGCNVFSLNPKYGCALSKDEAFAIAELLNSKRNVGDFFIKTEYSVEVKDKAQ